MSGTPRIGTRVGVQIEGFDLEFRALRLSEVEEVGQDLDQNPGDATAIAEAVCRKACLSDLATFDACAEEFPLVWSESVLQALVDRGIEDGQARIDRGVRLWRGGDRNYGRLAPHLLAFSAYDGGDYTESEFAGALAVAELIGTVKGIYQLMHAYLKAQRR